jgi:hypothetical protein
VREEVYAGHVRATVREESRNPFRQSVLILDQSATTQSIGLGPTPQSYVPLYEIWLSLRPRYYFDEHWSVRGRFDYTKELTNNQPTTQYREDVFGDIWTDLVYTAKVDRLWRGTKVNAGLRALWPTSKISQGSGTYVTPGVTAGALHKFEIKGESAPWWNEFHVGFTAAYLHPFRAATTGSSYGGFARTRQNVDGRSFVSDQLTGQTLPENTFWAILDTGLQLTPKLSITADFIVIDDWHYAATSGSCVSTLTDCAYPRPAANASQFTQDTWFVAGVDYALFDEIDIGLGYYNLANYLAPSGQARSVFGPDNVWWSPDARIFLDVSANLDVLFDDARGRWFPPKAAATERIAKHVSGF